MHIKLDHEGKVLYGKYLVKTNADLVKLDKLTGFHVEGYGIIFSNVCCYNDNEANRVMSIVQDEGIDAELVELHWENEIKDNIGTGSYSTLEEAYKKLIVVQAEGVVESGIDVPMVLITPPEIMGAVASCSFVYIDEETGSSYSMVEQVNVLGTRTSFTHYFMTSGKYIVQAGCNFSKHEIKITVGASNLLTGIKRMKIKELDAICNVAILAGFKSWALGSEHTYDFDYEAQINMSGTMNAISAHLTPAPIIWKIKENGPLPHTVEQFKMLFTDGMLFKQQTISKYWQLKERVLSSNTEAEVNAVVW